MRLVPRSKTVLVQLSQASGLFLVALGLVVLIGWAGDIFWLKGVLPGQETMKVNTAIAFILLGGALFSLSQRKESPAPFPWEDVVLGTVGLLALGTLAQYFLGIRLGLDELIFRDGDALSTYPGRMAPNTAVAVLAASGGLWMARRAAGRETMAAGALLVALFLVLMALLAGLGYASNLTSGYRWGAVTAMAMHTAVGFFVLGVGILGFLEGRKYVRWHLRAPLTAALLGGVLLLVVVALFGWETMLRWRTSSQQVVRTMESRHLLADLSGRISDLEREKRGSRLDGEDTQRVGVDGSHEAISATLLALRKTFALSGSSGDLERLSAYVDEKVTLDFKIMERWKEEPGLSDLDTMAASRSLMTEITSILAALDEQLRDSGEGARTEVRAQERSAVVVLPAGSLASLFLIGWALALFNAEAGVRQHGETRFRGIFDSTFQFIGLLRPDGVVVEANQTALAFAGCHAEDVVGRYFPDTPWWRFQSVEGRDRLIAALRRAALGEAVRFEIEVAGAEGKRAVIDFSLKPVRDHLGAVAFLVPEGHDITALKEAQQGLFEAEQRWDAALSGSELGVWDWNPINQKAYYSPHYYSMLGYSPKEFGNSGEDWSKRVHPDDLSATLAAIRDHLEGRTPVYSSEFRMRARDGGWRWILDRGKVMQRDAAGRPMRVVGTHTDITHRREAEERIGALQRQLEGILRFSPNFITLVDHDCRYLLVGDRVAESQGRPVEEMVGHVFEEVLDVELAALFRSRIERMQRDPQPFSVEDVVPVVGGERIFETQLFPLMNGNGEHYATGGIARDVTEMRAMIMTIEETLEEREILLREIHHRVKNNLQVVSSLLSIQARQLPEGDLRAPFEECRRRIASMSLIHDQLYRRRDIGRIDFAHYVNELVRLQRMAFGRPPDLLEVDVHVDVPPLEIGLAVPCGLIVNELLGNSCKHAFPNGRAGHIRIALLRKGESWELSVADNGVGDSSRDGSGGGLGLELVAALARQLKGQLVNESSGGRCVRICFPAPEHL